MATDILKQRNNADFLNKIQALGITLRSLIHEAALRAEPVNIDPEKGIDFYENVAWFEVQLIELALEMSGWRQNKAAKLLHMRPTTLNWKIKKLDIRPR